MKKIILLTLALPYFIMAQDETTDPLTISILEAKELQLKSIKCTSFSFYENIKEDEVIVETLHFEQNGNQEIYRNKKFYEDTHASTDETKTVYIYQNDSLIQEQSETYSEAIIYAKTLKYQGDQLVETKEERNMQNRPFIVNYTYGTTGNLVKVQTNDNYYPYTSYIYKNRQLIEKHFFPYEKDTIPSQKTIFTYSKNGNLQQELKIRTANLDTLLLKTYNIKNQLIYFRTERRNKSFYGNGNNYIYEEYISYDQRGRLSKKRFTPEVLANVVNPAQRFANIKYHYNNDLLIKVDSFNITKTYIRNEAGQPIKIISKDYQNIDKTLTKKTFIYNKEGRTKETTLTNFKTDENLKWKYEYLNGKIIKENIFLYNLSKKCTLNYNSSVSDQSLKKIKYCEVNDRLLPANIPYDIIEFFYDDSGRLISQYDKYANKDGSIHIHRIDSFTYANGRFKEMHVKRFQKDLVRYYSKGVYSYDIKGKLKHIFTIVEKDTIERIDFNYTNGLLNNKIALSYDHQSGKKSSTKKYKINFNTDGKNISKEYYNYNGKVTRFETWKYDKKKMLIEHTEFRSNTNAKDGKRKTYSYEYYKD